MQDLLVPAGLIIACLMAGLAIIGFTQKMATKTDLHASTEAIRELTRHVRELDGRIGRVEAWMAGHDRWAGQKSEDIERRLGKVETHYDGPERRRRPRDE